MYIDKYELNSNREEVSAVRSQGQLHSLLLQPQLQKDHWLKEACLHRRTSKRLRLRCEDIWY